MPVLCDESFTSKLSPRSLFRVFVGSTQWEIKVLPSLCFAMLQNHHNCKVGQGVSHSIRQQEQQGLHFKHNEAWRKMVDLWGFTFPGQQTKCLKANHTKQALFMLHLSPVWMTPTIKKKGELQYISTWQRLWVMLILHSRFRKIRCISLQKITTKRALYIYNFSMNHFKILPEIKHRKWLHRKDINFMGNRPGRNILSAPIAVELYNSQPSFVFMNFRSWRKDCGDRPKWADSQVL